MHAPMGLTSTPFLSYHEIDIKETDLLEDAWGLNSGFSDVIQLLEEYKMTPEEHLISSLIDHFREIK
jgi:hypothetical protein